APPASSPAAGRSHARRMTVTLPVWVLALLLTSIALLIVLYWSVKRRRRPSMSVGGAGGGIEAMERSLAGVAQGTICKGNRIEILQDGEYFDRLHEAIDAAERTIHIETFLAKEGKVTRALAEKLLARAAEGVAVRLMLDAS